MGLLLEVIACSVDDAVEAERGGAGRLEIVRELERGGLTPSPLLVAAIRARTRLPLRVMVREDDGYGAGGPREIERLQSLAREMASLGIDGLVCGFLRGGSIDEDAMEAVMAAAPGVPVTFHHAFDALEDAGAALGRLAGWPQVDRVLTTGGSGGWPARAARLAAYAAASARIGILPGGGVGDEALRVLSRTAGISEAHVGRAARTPPQAAGLVDHRRVAALVDAAK